MMDVVNLSWVELYIACTGVITHALTKNNRILNKQRLTQICVKSATRCTIQANPSTLLGLIVLIF